MDIESVKIWNIESKICSYNFDIPKILCALFLPGDENVVLGSKNGVIYLVELSSHEIIQEINVRNIYMKVLGTQRRGVESEHAFKSRNTRRGFEHYFRGRG